MTFELNQNDIPPNINEMAYNMALLSLDNRQMAHVLKVDLTTFGDWVRTVPGLSEQIVEGRAQLDRHVAKAILSRLNDV
jgi:hypothetical protein